MGHDHQIAKDLPTNWIPASAGMTFIFLALRPDLTGRVKDVMLQGVGLGLQLFPATCRASSFVGWETQRLRPYRFSDLIET